MGLPPASSFVAEPLLIATAAISIGTVAWLLRRGAPGRKRPRWVALGGVGALLVAIWFSPVATVAAHYLLSAHLLQITLLMGAVSPLLLLALPREPRLSVPPWLSRALRLLVHPIVAIVAVNAAFFGWHMAAPYDASLRNGSVYALQQLTLLATSVIFWWPIVSPFSPPIRSMSPLGKIGYIVLATIPQTFGGLAVALAHHVLYPVYALAPRVLGLDVMTDQQIAGASIALVSKIALFAAFTIIFLRMLEGSASEPDDGGGGGGGPRVDTPQPKPSGTPRWLDDLNSGRTVREPEPQAPPARIRVPAGSGSARG